MAAAAATKIGLQQNSIPLPDNKVLLHRAIAIKMMLPMQTPKVATMFLMKLLAKPMERIC